MKSFLANWKTTGTGALMIAVGGASLLGVSVAGAQPMTPDAALATIVAGVGLVFAKDGNVTGGTTPNR